MARDTSNTEMTSDRSAGLPRLGVALRHHVPIVVAALILALGLAGFYVVTAASTYTSSAVVLLSPAPGNPLTAETASSSSQLTVAMETEEQLVLTAAVRTAVSDGLGRQVPSERENLEAAVRQNTQMLEIVFTSRSPEAAQEGAQAYADGYLAYRAEQARSTQEARTQSLQQQVDETDASLRRAISEAADSDGSSYASQEVQLFASRLAALNDQLSASRAVGTDPGTVIDPADLPESPNELPRWLVVGGAAVFGLLAGAALALLLEWRRDLVRGSEAGTLGVPLFTTIATRPSGQLSVAGEDAHEAYRRLRAAVIANAPRPHVLAVYAVAAERNPTVGAELAVVLAEAKFSVLLIGTDPSSTSGGRVLGLGDQPGVAEVLSHGADPESLLMRAHGVSVLMPGLGRESFEDLTASSGFRTMVDDLRHKFDYVLLDGAGAPPAGGDEALLAADSALLVLTSDQTTRAQLAVALERLDHLGVTALGAVKIPRSDKGRARGRKTREGTPRGTRSAEPIDLQPGAPEGVVHDRGSRART